MKKFVSLLVAIVLMLSFSTMAMAENQKLSIGASPSPHAEFLELIKDDLAEMGIDLEIVVYTDYVMPNMALSAGDLDANYFQHVPYMDEYNLSVSDDQKLAAVIGVHFEPLGVYPGKTASFDALPDGATIAVPNDPSNEARALLLLEAAGLFTIKDGAGIAATKYDIEDNPKNIEILEIEAAQLPRTLQDVDMAVINGNFAIASGITMDQAIFVESTDSEMGTLYTNYIVVRAEDAEAEWIETLRKAICSQEIYDYITVDGGYNGGVVPSFTVETAE